MNNKIQELINEIKDRQKSHDMYVEQCDEVDDYVGSWVYRGQRLECDFLIKQLTLLLNSENEKSSQSSQGDGSNSSNAM